MKIQDRPTLCTPPPPFMICWHLWTCARKKIMQGNIPVCVQITQRLLNMYTSLYASIVFNLKCHGPPIRCKLQVMWPLIELDNQCFEKCHYVKTNTAPLEWLVCGFWHVTLREILEICLYRHKLHKPLDGCDELKPFTDTID